MDEFNTLISAEEVDGGDTPQLLFGTVTNWSLTQGVTFVLDGSDTATTKYYKIMKTGRIVHIGKRYAILKISGTYVVLGEVGLPPKNFWPEKLNSNAALSDVINTVNVLIDVLREQGIMGTPS